MKDSRLSIDSFCKRNNYTLEMLSAELDVSRATLFNWKKDARGLPRLVLLALHALEATPELSKLTKANEDQNKKQYRRSSYEKLEVK